MGGHMASSLLFTLVRHDTFSLAAKLWLWCCAARRRVGLHQQTILFSCGNYVVRSTQHSDTTVCSALVVWFGPASLVLHRSGLDLPIFKVSHSDLDP